MNKKVKAVIFDMDGVIVDTEPVHRYAYFQHFSELNIDVSEELFTSFTGNSTRNVFQRVNSIFNLNADVEELILRKRTIFNDAFDHKEDLELLEGVENLIKNLHENGVELILASSASTVNFCGLLELPHLDRSRLVLRRGLMTLLELLCCFAAALGDVTAAPPPAVRASVRKMYMLSSDDDNSITSTVFADVATVPLPAICDGGG